MGVCLSKQYVYAKNDYPLNSGTEKSSSYLRICMEKQHANPRRDLFGIPKRIQSSSSKLLGLFMRSVNPGRSKLAICDGPNIPRALCEHASSTEGHDLSPRQNVVKSDTSVTSSRSEDSLGRTDGSEGGGAFDSAFSIDTSLGENFRQGGEISKRSQKPSYHSYSHQGQYDAFVAATTELLYSSSYQGKEDKSGQGTISDGITPHSRKYAIADSLASGAMMGDLEYLEDTSSESSSDLFDLEFLSSDFVKGQCCGLSSHFQYEFLSSDFVKGPCAV